ncbi:hypothetical protein V491_09410 [Pseudogymnoascus sp. VKM F-3775]|nr:hypothetical protein V491_09410 [Pseudogymnoascus sp. VKM F-3775]
MGSIKMEHKLFKYASPTPDPPKFERGGLNGVVKSNDWAHFDRLADVLGLGNKSAVKAWMASDSFKPAYDELVRDWIDSRWDKAVDGMRRKRAPTLKQISKEILNAPVERYTSRSGIVNKHNFREIDHYALCLVRLRAANEYNFNGIFRGKTCSDEGKDQRLWQAMQRGGAEAWAARKIRDRLTLDEGMYA